MSLADELQKLQALHQSGGLSAAEYQSAKARLLGSMPPIPAETPPVYAATPVIITMDPARAAQQTRTWAMFLHLSMLGGHLIPGGGVVAPIVIWLVKRDELPGLEPHGCNAVNWIISSVIYAIVCLPFCFVVVGFLMLFALGIMTIVFAIMAAVKANEGISWRYPLSIEFLKPRVIV